MWHPTYLEIFYFIFDCPKSASSFNFSIKEIDRPVLWHRLVMQAYVNDGVEPAKLIIHQDPNPLGAGCVGTGVLTEQPTQHLNHPHHGVLCALPSLLHPCASIQISMISVCMFNLWYFIQHNELLNKYSCFNEYTCIFFLYGFEENGIHFKHFQWKLVFSKEL